MSNESQRSISNEITTSDNGNKLIMTQPLTVLIHSEVSHEIRDRTTSELGEEKEHEQEEEEGEIGELISKMVVLDEFMSDSD